MNKRFNVTGTCIPEKHYMADISGKIDEMIRLIEQDHYFTISRARQYGKTTALMLLWKRLKERYVVISMSFEGLGSEAFQTEDTFVRRFCARAAGALRRSGCPEKWKKIWDVCDAKQENMDTLRERIVVFCEKADQEVLLFIDEVDKSSDNQMFLNFLDILRELYLERAMGTITFKSVILASVYDIKNLKLKLRPKEERKYNSPWNIAADFLVDMSLSVREIQSMLEEYKADRGIVFTAESLAKEIYSYTGGYPFLVSLICLWVDERLQRTQELAEYWTPEGIRIAVREILKSTNTLFDDVIKNIENNARFSELVKSILLEGRQIPYKLTNPEIGLGVTFGILAQEDGICKISNLIFETYIYDHLIAAKLMDWRMLPQPRSQFITKDDGLNLDLVLDKFQEFMKAEYRNKDQAFLERQGRLLFLAFLKPIINGTGHYVVEPETRDSTRMDVIVFYGKREYILEFKIWHGEKRFLDGVSQLAAYMESRSQKQGWYLVFCFGKGRETLSEGDIQEIRQKDGKRIYAVIV